MRPNFLVSRSRLLRVCRWSAAAVLLGLAASAGAASPGGRELDYRIKAGFLYNFAKFVDWPPPPLTAASPFVVGILGDETAFEIIASVLRGRRIGEHPLEVRRLAPDEDGAACRVIFVPQTFAAAADHLRNRRSAIAALIVGESDGFSAHGGRIGFVPRGDNLRYQVNLATAKAAGLRLSATLASLAEIVASGAP
jgi:hypothetical protein